MPRRQRLRAGADDQGHEAVPADADRVPDRVHARGPGHPRRLRRGRGRLPDQAGQPADPAPQGRRVRRSVPQDARARRAEREARGSASRERTAELEKSEAALRAASARRTSSSRCSPTSCATRSRRCGPGSTSLLAVQGRRRAIAGARSPSMNRQLDHMVRLIDDLLDVVADQPRHARDAQGARRALAVIDRARRDGSAAVARRDSKVDGRCRQARSRVRRLDAHRADRRQPAAQRVEALAARAPSIRSSVAERRRRDRISVIDQGAGIRPTSSSACSRCSRRSSARLRAGRRARHRARARAAARRAARRNARRQERGRG